MEVEYVDWGLANNFGTHIELNKNLKQYPKLHYKILRHELRHTNKPFSKQDLKNDFLETKVSSVELIKFMIKNPKSMIQILPFYWTKRYGLVYDINLILTYLIIVFIISGSILVGLSL